MWTFILDGTEIEEPIGWDAIEFQANRLESHGIDQPFSTELTFIGKAARILKAYWDSEFLNAVIPFQILSDVNTYSGKYEFDGFINMASYVEENVCDITGWQIKVGIFQSDFRDKFLSRQGIEIDLLSETNLDGESVDPLTLDSIRLHSQQLYLQGIALQEEEKALNINSSVNPVFPVFWDKSDFKGQFGNTLNPTGSFASGTNVIFQNNADSERDFLISGRAKASVKNLHTVNSYRAYVVLGKINSSGNPVPAESITIFTTPLIAPLATYNIDISFSDEAMSLLEGYRLNFVLELEFPNLSGYNVVFFTETNLKLVEKSQSFASQCSGLTVFNALERCLQLMTGIDEPLISDTLSGPDGCYWNNFLTTGFYIRNAQQFSSTNPQMKTSFEKLFDNLSRIFCLGWTFETVSGQMKIRVERRSYFYDNSTKIAEFNKVSGLVQTPFITQLKNGFIFGFNDNWRNNQYSGIFEIHTYRTYFVDNRARTNSTSDVLDLRSEFICAGTAIEFSRRLQFWRENSGSSDRQNDYQFFVIWTNQFEVSFDEISGTGYDFVDETGAATFSPGTVSYGSNFILASSPELTNLYNIYHSPARVAARHWTFWGMTTYGLPDAKVKFRFQSGDYWVTYESRIGSESLVSECNEILETEGLPENSDIGPEVLKTAYQTPYLRPIVLDLTAPQSLCNFLDMANNGTGYVKVTSGNQAFYGFILESNNQPENPSSGMTQLKLLLSSTLPIMGDYSDDYSDDYFI